MKLFLKARAIQKRLPGFYVGEYLCHYSVLRLMTYKLIFLAWLVFAFLVSNQNSLLVKPFVTQRLDIKVWPVCFAAIYFQFVDLIVITHVERRENYVISLSEIVE